MKPSLLKGTRDFLPGEMLRRAYIFQTIKDTFESYGFQPIETPALERLTTLMGKYGEEGDQLLFKVLNNGDFLSKVDDDTLLSRDLDDILSKISKRGLRYDLTVPLARYVAQNQNELAFPFKRYQIQPVWRADRPQKGRYQEFYQCDADVVGSGSLLYEVDFIHIYSRVFRRLGLPIQIKINHRGLLTALIQSYGLGAEFEIATTAIDKWDKVGREGVKKELLQLDVEQVKVDSLLDLLENGDLQQIKENISGDKGEKAWEEIQFIFEQIEGSTAEQDLVFAPELARGLNYYTGCIFEVIAINGDLGSIGGGGRYADLTSIFGMKDMPGVGISFGAERIYDLLESQSLFPDAVGRHLDILFCCFDEESLKIARDYAEELRGLNMRIDVYPEAAKLGKQLKYADQVGSPYVAIIGEVERQQNALNLKHMASGQQVLLPFSKLKSSLQEGDDLKDQFSEK